MGYISVKEAADRLNISPRRVQQLCQQGLIYGAVREGKHWLIPDTISGKYEKNDLPAERQSQAVPAIL